MIRRYMTSGCGLKSHPILCLNESHVDSGDALLGFACASALSAATASRR